MHAGCVACWLPLVSHGEYADGTDGQTDGRQIVTLRFPLDASSVKTSCKTLDATGVVVAMRKMSFCYENPLRSKTRK